MALFKPLRGNRSTLEAQALHDGYAYFCTDDGSFHIDYVDADGNLQRKQVNQGDLEALGYKIDNLPQADWNQNDSTTKDYVKNRPFYGETSIITVADGEYASEPLEDIGGAYVAIIQIDENLLSSLVVEDITFVNITFDGIEYNNLELQWVEALETFAVGNLSLANPILGTEYQDTEEPFALAIMGSYDILITDLTQSTTHTVKMDVPQLQVVKQIDDRYLSNDIVRMEVAERLFGRINSIENGETIVGRAYRDANDNNIINTYLTKENAADLYVSKEEELNKQLEKNAIIAKFNTSINELATETVRLKNLIGMVKIDWGDGIVNTELVHSYAQSGSYTCKIYGVTSIGESAFAWSDNLISIEIPDSVISIDKFAFYECCNLTNVTLPKSITNISEGTFQNCTRLTIVEIPNLVGIVGVGAFQNCIRLTDVVLSNSTSWILSSAFLNCANLKNIEIPDSVGWIHNGAFNGCKSLKSVIIPNSVVTVSQDAFYDCENLTIYCEAESKPEDWDSDWNSSGCPVVWSYKNKDYPEVVTKLEKIENNYVTTGTDQYISGHKIFDTIEASEFISQTDDTKLSLVADGIHFHNETATTGWTTALLRFPLTSTFNDEDGPSCYLELPDERGTLATREWVQENAGSQLNLANGEAPGSVQTYLLEADSTTGEMKVKGSTAYGKYSVALNQDNKAYQRAGFATGGGNEVGLTEEEFNILYGDGGTDPHGSTYSKANSYSNVGGERNKVKARGSHIGAGAENTIEVGSEFSGIVAGEKNILHMNTKWSGILAGYGHHIVEGSTHSGILDGYNNIIGGKYSGTGGSNNEIVSDNTHAFGKNLKAVSGKGHNKLIAGQFNDYNSLALFQVGAGNSEDTRTNAFEVHSNGAVVANKAPAYDNEVVRLKELNEAKTLILVTKDDVDALEVRIAALEKFVENITVATTDEIKEIVNKEA